MKKKSLIISFVCLAMCMSVFAAENSENTGEGRSAAEIQTQADETQRGDMRGGGGEMRGMPPRGDENDGFRERGGAEPPRQQNGKMTSNGENAEIASKSENERDGGASNSEKNAEENQNAYSKPAEENGANTNENGDRDENFGERPQMNEPRGFGGEDPQNRPEDANRQGEKSLWEILKEYSAPILSLVLLAFAFMFVKLYKRR